LPLYEYKCEKCSHRFEKIESNTASETKKCPKCGSKAKRQLSAPAIQFKGTGWYVTDYGGKKSSAPSGESSGEGDSSKASDKNAEAKASGDKGDKSEKSEKSDKAEKAEKADRAERSEKGSSKKKK
jgi:putative FmdB family regulatory protein